jgi:PAS domain S-box-containing protein
VLFRSLPVVNQDNKLVGILSRSDFIKIFYNGMRRADDAVQALIRSAHNAIIGINSYGIVDIFNESAARITGISLQDARGKFIYDLVPYTGLMRVLETGKAEVGSHVEIGGQSLLVNRSPICEGSRVVGALSIIHDISEISEMDKKLAATRHKIEALEIIFESMKQGIIVVDQNNIVTFVNRSY